MEKDDIIAFAASMYEEAVRHLSQRAGLNYTPPSNEVRLAILEMTEEAYNACVEEIKKEQ